MIVKILFICLTFIQAKLECGHNSDFDSNIEFIKDASTRRLTHSEYRDSILQPIRLYFYYLDMNMDSSLEYEFKNELMTMVKHFYERRLSVYPFKSNLILAGVEECASIKIPEEHKTEGLPADIILYVYGNNYEGEYWVARAGACFLEGYPYNNVIAGRIEINSSQYNLGLSFEDKMQTVIHEIFHILGFSNSLFQYFVKEDGTSYTSDELTLFTSLRGKEVVMLTTPTVVKRSQEGFGCSDMLGIELEDSGGSGTIGSHWEKRIMFNDFMIGDIGPTDIIYSDISFAVLQDSGWYKVNWNYTDSIAYGRDKGCKFHEEKCIIDGIAQFEEFCTESSKVKKCDYLRLNKGYCNRFTHSQSLPEYMSYFFDPRVGSNDDLMDNCPTIQHAPYGSCRGYDYETTLLDLGSGETVGINSRCFEHNLLKNSYSYTAQYKTTRPGCYEIRCNGSQYEIILDNKSYLCIPGQSISVSDYNGSIECPGYKEVCEIENCPLSCRGTGICKNGVCICDKGYGRYDCGISCDSSCFSCNGRAANDCISCEEGYTLQYGRCISSISESCSDLCTMCYEDTECRSCVVNAVLKEGICRCQDGYYNLNNKCIESTINCRLLCEVCDEYGACTLCKENAHLYDGRNCECNSNYRENDNECKTSVQIEEVLDNDEEDEEESGHNYMPIYCLGIISGIFSFTSCLFVIISYRRKLKKIQIQANDISPVTEKSFVPIKISSPTCPKSARHIYRDYWINKWKSSCYPVTLFYSESGIEQIVHNATVYSLFMFELCLLGLFYFTLDDSDIREESIGDLEIVSSYTSDDLIVLLLCLGCSFALELIYKILATRKNMILMLILGFVVSAGSMAGTVIIDIKISSFKAKLWTINFIIMFLIEIILIQTLTSGIVSVFLVLHKKKNEETYKT